MHYAFQPDAPLQQVVPGHPGKYLVVHFSTLPKALLQVTLHKLPFRYLTGGMPG